MKFLIIPLVLLIASTSIAVTVQPQIDPAAYSEDTFGDYGSVDCQSGTWTTVVPDGYTVRVWSIHVRNYQTDLFSTNENKVGVWLKISGPGSYGFSEAILVRQDQSYSSTTAIDSLQIQGEYATGDSDSTIIYQLTAEQDTVN